jgi:hypothetical protein
MKRQGWVISILGIVLLSGVAVAQTASGMVAAADIPFSFSIQGRTFPAGSYVIRGQGAIGGLFSLLNTNSGAASFVSALPSASGEPSKRTVLAFRKYGNHYYLARIDRSGYADGYAFAESKAEKEMRADLGRSIQQAQQLASPEVVLLAAK